LFWVTGCAPLLVMHGAQPIPKNQVELQLGAVGEKNTGEYGNFVPPRPMLAARIGLGDDIDMGTRLFGSGVGFDMRYRFFQKGRLHIAMTPGLNFAYATDSSTVISDFYAPVTVEWDMGQNISLIADARMVFREFWLLYGRNTMGKGQFNRLEVFMGGGGRFEWHPKRFRLGLGFQTFYQPVDGAKLAVTGGLDLGLRIGRDPDKPKRERKRDRSAEVTPTPGRQLPVE
jgi:hypothetical protein